MPAAGQVFDVVPSTRRTVAVATKPMDAELSTVDAVAIPVTTDGDVPVELHGVRHAVAHRARAAVRRAR